MLLNKEPAKQEKKYLTINDDYQLLERRNSTNCRVALPL